jgi:hypothetical protein
MRNAEVRSGAVSMTLHVSSAFDGGAIEVVGCEAPDAVELAIRHDRRADGTIASLDVVYEGSPGLARSGAVGEAKR